MIKRLLLLLLFPIGLFAQVQPINVLIQNPSFEQFAQPLHSDTCGLRAAGPATDWTFDYDSWIFQPSVPNPCGNPVPPDGKTVALVSHSTISQDTGVAASDLQAKSRNGVYLMNAFVTNYFGVYPGYYEVKISLLNSPYTSSSVTHELCSTDGLATQDWAKIVLTCPAPQYVILNQWPDGSPFDLKAHILISLSNTQWWPLLFDDVSLTFTPIN